MVKINTREDMLKDKRGIAVTFVIIVIGFIALGLIVVPTLGAGALANLSLKQVPTWLWFVLGFILLFRLLKSK
jgi:sterol desaturase/sphingolipid hydroxylase (fatty acid hydroxylase superfamily)